jgi:hypothetical protein
VAELVRRRARLAVRCGCDGVIAAAGDDPDALRRFAQVPDLLVREAAPDRFHQPVVRKLLEINDERGFVNLSREADGYRTPVGLNKPV